MHRPGDLLARRYRLDERVGAGGMGEVWRGTDTELERTVAIKIVRTELLDESGFRERFRAEARTMARIKHPGVVAVHDYYSDESGAFLVMEFIEGEALSGKLRRFGRLDPVRAMTLVADAADALQAAHDRGVVHRDIKPGNLLVTPDGKLLLTDFGIARSAASTTLTATGALIGTATYLAPEQVLGKPATASTDLYALGVVAYECLAGRRPFEGDNPFDVAMKRLRESPPPLPDGIPPAVLAVVERAMAAEPEQRWRSATELAAAARRASASASSAATSVGRVPPPHASPPPPSRPAQPSPLPPTLLPAQPSPSPAVPQPVPQAAAPAPPGAPAAPAAPGGYPASGYRAPGYGAAGYRHPAATPPANVLGLLGMIFGIAGIALLCCHVGVAMGVAAVVLGAIGLRKVSEGRATNRAQAVAGLICGLVAIVLYPLYVLALVAP